MRKLLLAPDQAGYTAAPGTDAKMVQLEGGPPASRLAFIGAAADVSVSWSLNEAMADYLTAFFRAGALRASEPFLIDIVLDGAGLEEYTVRFVPGSFRLRGYAGSQRVYDAQLAVNPRTDDPATDLSLVVSFEEYGESSPDIYALLAKLVTEDLPA